MRDSYDILFEHYDRDIFFSESLKSIIYIDESKIKIEWDNLKNRLFNNELTYIRGYGRDAKGTIAFLELYKNLFSNLNIKKDSSNNNVPTILMSRLTGLNKKLKKDTVQQERIQNYQISHLFGKTKNPLLFSAPWNFAYIPKYIDPFTGHETQGEHSRIFKEKFDKQNTEKFKLFIDEYNLIVKDLINPKIDVAIDNTICQLKSKQIQIDFKKFIITAKEELSEIKIN